MRGSLSRPGTSRSFASQVQVDEETLAAELQAEKDANLVADLEKRIDNFGESAATSGSNDDAETERLMMEYLENNAKMGDARNADRDRQAEALKAKLDIKYGWRERESESE